MKAVPRYGNDNNDIEINVLKIFEKNEIFILNY